MSDWTAERLDALPPSTVIEIEAPAPQRLYRGDLGAWIRISTGDFFTTERITATANLCSIRVVSVPVEALLSEATLDAIEEIFLTTDREVIGGAIAHVTGSAA